MGWSFDLNSSMQILKDGQRVMLVFLHVPMSR